MSNKNALTFMKVEKGIEVDWAQIQFNNMCTDWIDGQRCRRKCKQWKVKRQEGDLSFNAGYRKIV